MTADEKDVTELLARRRAPQEILAMLMSRGYREVEAKEFLEHVAKQAPPAYSTVAKPTVVGFAAPGIAFGGALVLIGLGLALFAGWTSGWFFIVGIAFIVGGLVRLGTGSS